MRILRFFLFSFLGIVVLTALAFFFGREILLLWGSSMLQADYNSLQKKGFGQECMQKFAYNQEYWTQLRFTSNKEYNLEVVCADFLASPIVLESRKLPPLLFKQSFGSGFILDDRELPSFVELNSLGRKIFIYKDGQKIHANYLFKPDLDYMNGPLSSCQAHNYQCCSLDVQSGLGEQNTEVNDCPKSCYQSCLLRPVILSFNSRPALDLETRMVELRDGEALTLSYVLGDGKNDAFGNQLLKDQAVPLLEKIQTLLSKKSDENQSKSEYTVVTIDLGDGEIWQSIKPQDDHEHIYNCQNRTCYFQVKLSAQDQQGVLSVDNELSKMVVKVSK